MTFNDLCSVEFTASFSGSEIVGLYLSLARDEETLDRNQRAALERLRSILYENLSVEQLEDIGRAYASRLAERCFP